MELENVVDADEMIITLERGYCRPFLDRIGDVERRKSQRFRGKNW